MNYQLTQTGEQVQDILNQAPTTEETLQAEITRSTNKDDALELAIGNEKTRAEGVEGNLSTVIGNEKTRAEGAELVLQQNINAEALLRSNADTALQTGIDGINAKIPAAASSSNQLADKAFVNSSIATNTATFRGTYDSVAALDEVTADNNDYAFVVATDTAGNTVYNRYKYVEGSGWVFEYALNNSSFTATQWAAINSAITAALVAKLTGLPTATELTTQLNAIIDSVATEKSRAEGIESGLRTDVNANATAIGTEKTRAEGVEGNLSTAIGNEKTRAEAAELLLQQNINAEALLRSNADTALQTGIDGINAKIPAAASSSNQLADKSFVNSSIATNTADFKGTYNSLQELQQVSANNNDYGFVVSVDSDGNTVYNRYKYVDGTGWVFEYALNNSSFTSAQWAAIQSGITAALVAKINGLPDITALNAMFAAITNLIPSAATSENKLVDYAQMVAALATKQNTLTFDNVPTENSNNPVKSGGVYSAIATVTAAVVGLQSSKQDVLTFDQYPTAGSDNPVKSKGIYEKLSEKQATLVPGTNLDTTPTANSNNPVTSGGVKAALDLKANQSTLAEEVSRAQGAESALSSRISTNATDIANLQQLYNDLQQSKPVPVTALPSTGQQQGVIYRLAGTTSYSDYMWNGSSWVLMATYNNAIDPRPKKASQNLVTSGGVFDNMGALDVSELNATENPHTLAQYADLSSALASIPSDYQKGGMSIKFVQSSDNKYVQYRLMADEWSTNTDDWSFCGNDVLTENSEFVKIVTDKDDKILYGIKANGDFYFGAGCPKQVRDALEPKVDKEKGKSLIDADFASMQSFVGIQEWLQVIIDKDEKIIEGTKKNKKVINLPLDCPTLDEIRASIPKSKWYGKTAVTLGDSHSQRRNEWMPKLCEMLGMEFLESLNSQIPVGNVTPPAYEMYINAMTAQVAALISLKSVAIPDVIFVENVHYFYNDNPSAFPFKPSSMELVGEYNMTKAEEIAYFNEHFSEIVSSVQDKEPRKVIKTVINGKTCTVTFSASSISSGTFEMTLDGVTISTELTAGMTLAQAVSKIMEWQFGEYTDWVNVSKTDNSITFRYNGEGQAAFNFSYNAGGTGLSASAGNITDIGESIYRYYASNTMDDWNTTSKWIRVVDWYQGYMQNKGVMEMLQENFPKSVIVVLGLANWRLSESDYDDLNYYEFTHTESFLLSESRKEGFLECGKMYDCKTVDVEKMSGISPINYLTFYNPNEVHPKSIGYERWAETIAKELD